MSLEICPFLKSGQFSRRHNVQKSSLLDLYPSHIFPIMSRKPPQPKSWYGRCCHSCIMGSRWDYVCRELYLRDLFSQLGFQAKNGRNYKVKKTVISPWRRSIAKARGFRTAVYTLRNAVYWGCSLATLRRSHTSISWASARLTIFSMAGSLNSIGSRMGQCTSYWQCPLIPQLLLGAMGLFPNGSTFWQGTSVQFSWDTLWCSLFQNTCGNEI